MEREIKVWSKDVVDTLKKLFYEGLIVTGKQIGRASCRERVSTPV